MNARTQALTELGVSIWLDDLSRDRIVGGGLRELIGDLNVVGITTNPTIFATAIAQTRAYDEQLNELARQGLTATEAAFEITTDDVIAAADILRPVHTASAGRHGWVSIEVGADVAQDAAATLEQARRLAAKVARTNVFVKIPATSAGLTAITAAIAEGISVNVTLIFGLQRYREVIDAYLTGLERAHAAGIELGEIRSVASFFVSRVDVAVDAALETIGGQRAHELRGRAGAANARLAYEVFLDSVRTGRARVLAEAGAHEQLPLWASTGVKDPALADTYYVEQLVAPRVVNTMPEKTLRAVADHGRFGGDTITGSIRESHELVDALHALGVSLDDITQTLERDGVAKFLRSGEDLLATVEAAMGQR